MRKFLIAASVLAGLSVGAIASASNSDDVYGPSAKAYVNFAFGGKSSSVPSNFHYGLRLDQDSRMATRMGRTSLPAIMQADFNLRDGFSRALVNGVPFASHVVAFDEDGGDVGYSALDWGLLAIGAAGLGFGIAEVLKTKDDKDPQSTTGSTTGTTGGGGLLGTGLLGSTTGTTTGTTGTTTGGGLLGTGLLGFAGGEYGDNRADAERQAWLDGGTGHMGDLHAVR